MSMSAYRHTQVRIEPPRAMERRLFAEVTAGLLAAEQGGLDLVAAMPALDRNRQMWGTFRAACIADDNALPDRLRAGIVSLALFVDRHTSAIARGEATIGDLIAINRTVMEGLEGTDATA